MIPNLYAPTALHYRKNWKEGYHDAPKQMLVWAFSYYCKYFWYSYITRILKNDTKCVCTYCFALLKELKRRLSWRIKANAGVSIFPLLLVLLVFIYHSYLKKWYWICMHLLLCTIEGTEKKVITMHQSKCWCEHFPTIL